MTQPVKSEFMWQDRTWKTFWNGKEYADGTKYITCTSPTGSQVKVSYNVSKPHAVYVSSGHSKEFGQEAVRTTQLKFK